jgi:tetratricopeptide (TPR) repeat protein
LRNSQNFEETHLLTRVPIFFNNAYFRNNKNGAYRKALADFESILSDLLARYGERHERVGAALHNVAIANLRAGSLDDAMDAIEEAIKIRSRALGRSHPRVADSLVELGIILLSMDEHEDALKVFERALKLRREEREEAFGDEDIDESKLKIAKVLNNIGCVNFEKGNMFAAEAAFDEAVSLQRSVFKNWFTLVCGVDANSPGILTMASTMCNKAYVEIERDNFDSAIGLFQESLKIQRNVLGDDNKLVQSSLDNLGYAYAMLGKYEKALAVFTEVWNAVKDSHDFPEEKAAAVRKVAICHLHLQQYEQAFPLIELLEDLQHEISVKPAEYDRTRKLLGEVNYQILKLPSLSNATNRALGCAVCMGGEEEDVNLDAWIIEKPENTSKMSGHRVTHA